MTLESNKTLGGVGALLIAIGSFFPILSLVGIILVLIAMKGLAESYNEEEIFTNALYGFIFGIVGIAAAIVIFFGAIFGGFQWPFVFPFATVVLVIAALVVMFVFFVLQAIMYRRSFTLLSEKSGEQLFETAGLLLIIGAILTIILVGLVLLLVAWILAAVGFFSIKTELPASTAPPKPLPVPAEKKFCQQCGAENRADASFCKKCGKKLDY